MCITDNYDLFERHEMEKETLLAKKPVCVWCKEPICDEYLYDIAGNLYHEKCVNDCFRQDADEYER
jgi:hypothetical protein